MKFPNVLLPLAMSLALVAPTGAAEAASDGSSQESVIELGKITPDGPYRLWAAVNKVLLDYALLTGGEELKSQIAGLTASPFDGKSPLDVLTQTVEFRDTLERILDRLELPKVRTYADPLGRDVTPGVVFVNAGHIVDAVVAAFYSASNRPDRPLGDFYDVPVTTGKSPSDVYALAYLATTRLQIIAAF